MNSAIIKDDFRKRVCEQIELESQGVDRFRVKTPFRFEDGDHYNITLRRENDGWILSDEASTIMHLSYWMDADAITYGNRQEIVENSLSTYSVENRDGELVIPVREDGFGDALFNFVQALTKVSDISFLSREIVRSTFMEDLFAFLKKQVPPDRIQFNWKAERDATGKYPVDARINQLKRPIFLYGIPNEDKMKDATISLLRFENWNFKFQSVAVFEDLQSMPRKPLARFLDVNDKPFSSLDEENKERLAGYLHDVLQEA
jgi:hypothetical protein